MSFARKVWKLLVALKDGLALLLLLLFFAALYAVLSVRPGPGLVKEGALLLDLDGVIVEEPAAIDPLSILLSGELPLREYRARDVARAIRLAAKDDRIDAVVLDLSGFLGGGNVHLQEIGRRENMPTARRSTIISVLLILCCLPALPNVVNLLIASNVDTNSFALGYVHEPAVEGLAEAYQAHDHQPMYIYIGDITSVWIRAHYGPRAATIETVRSEGRDWPADDMQSLLEQGEVVAVVEPCDDSTCCATLLEDLQTAFPDTFYCFAVAQ
jgi:hypothetical protein